MFNLFGRSKTTIILILLLFTFSAIMIIYLLINPVKKPANKILNNIEPPVYIQADIKNNPNFKVYLETKVGQTTEEQISSLPGRKSINTLPNNTTEYLFTSPYSHLDNVAITQNRLLIYKKVITILPNTPLPMISAYTNQYGPPDSEYTGSLNHGRVAKTYVYASKGFAIVGNPNTDEVYEIQTFIPLSVDEYLRLWGQDIKKYPDEPQGE
ncbi:hypothetical protein HY384_01790 [Candidatus Daviesbacteria bacterium]|nr:hypothetical protein [Candidatus Daviesbacteria bacterium]